MSDRIVTAAITREEINPPRYVGWVGKHMVVGGRTLPYSMPAVIPPIDQTALEMTREIQLMSYQLMVKMNPAVTPKIWRAVHQVGLCLNNKPQDGYDGGEPHADYVNGKDTQASLPRYDKQQRIFQGTFIRGDRVADVVVCRPGVHGIDARQPMPLIEEIVARNWYVVAVNVGPEKNPGNVTHFAQGQGGMIVYPFIFDRTITFPVKYLFAWDSGTLPNPTTVYVY